MRLTPAGEAFLNEARRLMTDTEVAIEAARRAAHDEVGRLDIAYIGALSDAKIPRSLRNLRAQSPHVVVTLRHLRNKSQPSRPVTRCWRESRFGCRTSPGNHSSR